MTTFAPAETPGKAPWSSTHIDAASHGALAFCQIYYETFDEPTRRAQEIPKLFLPTAKVLWNGNPVPGDKAGLQAWLEAMPLSRHDLQTVDCHPVAALEPTPSSAPDLIVNVTGSVLHGPTVMSSSDNPNLPPRDHPRKFHEIFMLRVAEATGEGNQPKLQLSLHWLALLRRDIVLAHLDTRASTMWINTTTDATPPTISIDEYIIVERLYSIVLKLASPGLTSESRR